MARVLLATSANTLSCSISLRAHAERPGAVFLVVAHDQVDLAPVHAALGVDVRDERLQAALRRRNASPNPPVTAVMLPILISVAVTPTSDAWLGPLGASSPLVGVVSLGPTRAAVVGTPSVGCGVTRTGGATVDRITAGQVVAAGERGVRSRAAAAVDRITGYRRAAGVDGLPTTPRRDERAVGQTRAAGGDHRQRDQQDRELPYVAHHVLPLRDRVTVSPGPCGVRRALARSVAQA